MQKIIETIFNVTIILTSRSWARRSATTPPVICPSATPRWRPPPAQHKRKPSRFGLRFLPLNRLCPCKKNRWRSRGPLGQPLIPPPQPETVALADRGQPVLRAEPPARKLTMQARYNSCLQQAEHTFTVAWDASCKTSEAERQKNYQRCLTTRGLSKAACERAHKHVPEKDCKLPASLSDRLSAQLQSRAGQCLQEFRAAAG